MPRQSTAIGRSAAASRVISAEAAILRAVFGRGRKSSAANSARLRSANLLSVTEYLHALALGWRRAEGWAERPRGQRWTEYVLLPASASALWRRTNARFSSKTACVPHASVGCRHSRLKLSRQSCRTCRAWDSAAVAYHFPWIDRHSSNDAGCGVKRSAQVAAASANAMTERSMFEQG